MLSISKLSVDFGIPRAFSTFSRSMKIFRILRLMSLTWNHTTKVVISWHSSDDLGIKVDVQYWQKLSVHRHQVIRVISHHHHRVKAWPLVIIWYKPPRWVKNCYWDSMAANISCQIKSIRRLQLGLMDTTQHSSRFNWYLGLY